MNSQFWQKEGAKDVLIILGCALLNVLLTLFLYPKFAHIGTDGVFYALMAKSLALGQGLTVFHQPHVFFSPGLSFVIVPVYFIIGNIELAAQVTMLALSILTLPFFYYAMRFFVERHIASIATLFLAVNATVIWRNVRPIAQPLAAFLSVVLFFCLTKYITCDKGGRKVFALAFLLGLVTGALYLARPEYIVLIGPLTIFLFWNNRKTVALPRNLAIISLTIVGFALCVMPYVAYLHTHTGQWTFTGRLSQQIEIAKGLIEINQVSSAWDSPDIPDNSIWSFLQSIFAPKFAKIYFSHLYDIEWFLLRIFGIIGFAFFGIGLWKVIAEKRFVILQILAVPTAMLFAFAMGFNGDFGYLEPYLFIFISLIAIGCASFISTLTISLPSVSWRRLLFSGGIIALSAGYFAFPVFQNFLFRPDDTGKPIEYQLLGQYVRDSVESSEEQLLVARKPEIAFYAGADWVGISGLETPEQLLDIMKAKNARYLAIDTRSMGEAAAVFFDTEEKHLLGGLEFIQEFTYGSERVRLYRLGE